MPLNYNVNPAPTPGTTAYGQVPGQIGIPPSTYDQVSSIYPNLGGQVGQMSGNIGNELAGQLSPETIASLQQHAAQFGVQSGMPNSQFEGNQGLAQLGLDVRATQHQGGQDLLAAQTSLAGTQTPQSLAADIASRNATMASAPNPQLAAQQQMADWMTKFNASMGAGRSGGVAPSSSPSGGTGAYAPSIVGGGVSRTQATYSPDTYSNYNPGGSSPFGTIDTGGGNTLDMFDPLAGSPAGLPAYGSMPNYGAVGPDPIAAALGGSGTMQPSNQFGNQFGDVTGNYWAQQQDPFTYAADTGNYDYSTGG
jgi:hypothetical protein